MSCLAVLKAVTPFSCSSERPADTIPDRVAPDYDPKGEVAMVARGNNQFAFELYAKLREKDGNLFFSPYSLETALAMTSAGARGETLEQMNKTLHFTLNQERLHPAFAALIKRINGDDKKRGYQLSTANALWGQKDYGFLPEFLKLTKEHYGAGLNEVDFAGATEKARKTINTWVEKETKDKIKDLIKEGVLDSDTRLVLTNAIYFKGDWASQFKKNLTKDAPFNLGADKKVQVPMMHQEGKFKYLAGDDFQALEMPYVGKELTMVVLLPKKVDGLADLEKTLTADKLAVWLTKIHESDVDVTLPKFKVTAEFQLKKELSEMGMPLAFRRGADFSGMDGKKDNLFIGEVVHKAFVDVNEEGTEAAAATAVVVAKSDDGPERQLPVFRADHPFVFLIRDTRTESILFLGRVSNPK
jgi:serpin B